MNETSSAKARRSEDPQGEFPFDVIDYLPYLIATIAGLRDAALDERLRKYGLNVGLHRVLGVLRSHGSCAMSEVASFAGVERTSVTRIADRLEALGLLRREPRGKDRRKVRLELTDEGRRIHDNAVHDVFDMNSGLLAAVSEESGRAAARVLQQIARALAPEEADRERVIHFRRLGE